MFRRRVVRILGVWVVKSGKHGMEQLWKFVFQTGKRTYVSIARISRRAAETDRFSSVSRDGEGRNPWASRHPCRHLPVYKGLCFGFGTLSFSLSLFSPLPPRLWEVGRSCERMDTKGTGVRSPGRISSTAPIRGCEYTFAKLCAGFSKLHCNRSSREKHEEGCLCESRDEFTSAHDRQSKGKKRRGRPTRRARGRRACARIEP